MPPSYLQPFTEGRRGRKWNNGARMRWERLRSPWDRALWKPRLLLSCVCVRVCRGVPLLTSDSLHLSFCSRGRPQLTGTKTNNMGNFHLILLARLSLPLFASLSSFASLHPPTSFLPTTGALQAAAAKLTQSKYLNFGNHFKALNTAPLSPPSSLPDMDRRQAHRMKQLACRLPQTNATFSLYLSRINPRAWKGAAPSTAVSHNSLVWCMVR